MKVKELLQVIGFILVCQLAGGIGSVFTASSIPDWYAELAKPVLAPPNWVFGPVWTTLFTLMGISAFLVWKKGSKRSDVRLALGVFGIQLLLNILWSIIFFGLQNPGIAFIEIILLWLAIAVTMIAFAKVSKPAAWLLLPYLLWVSFASYLNYSIWQLNSEPQRVYCTQDAIMCPDGTYVGRSGPNCEFDPCPGN